MGTAGLNYYHDQPLFGMDIGTSSLKVMQISFEGKKSPKVIGYGVSPYYPSNSLAGGVIANKKALGEAIYDLLSNRLNGVIDTRRVACTVPSSHTFSRPMKLPIMDSDELAEAVKLEVEQYVPVPIDSLYLDYEISAQSDEQIELLTVAIPKKIIDGYVDFLQTMGLEPVSLEPTMNALSRLFNSTDPTSSQPSILIDFGSISTDMAVLDRAIFVNSTVSSGSDTLVNLISKSFSMTADEARQLKNSKGIADSSTGILELVQPSLENLVKEVQKVIRYYTERNTSTQRSISQVLLTGGGSTMPGLEQHLSKALGIPARSLNPWSRLDFGELPLPGQFDLSMYLTVAGEAMLKPGEIYS